MISLSRRRLLRAAGALPFLPWLASANDTEAPQRLIVMLGPLNGLQPGWEPASAGPITSLPPRLEALRPFQSRLAIVSGLDGPVASFQDGHKQGMSGLWTGSTLTSSEYPSTASIDQLLAPTLSAGRPFRSLEFGVMSDVGLQSSVARMIYGPGGSPIAPESSPTRMYARLFGSSTAIHRPNHLDVVKRQLRLAQANVSVEDKAKLESHLDALAQLERRLTSSSACSTAAPEAIEPVNDAFPRLYTQQLELLVAALACDRTRVASFMPTTSISNLRFRWVNGISSDFHFGTMHGGTEAQRVALNTWFVERFADLLRRLDAVPEGTGTLLDHTTVVWAGEMATGDHRNWPLPMVIAGGPRSRFAVGTVLKVDHEPFTRVLQSVLHSFGRRDLRLGAYDDGRGPLPGLLVR
jgi:hypothetical protein